MVVRYRTGSELYRLQNKIPYKQQRCKGIRIVFHGSGETWLGAEFSASVGTPPPFKDQVADEKRQRDATQVTA